MAHYYSPAEVAARYGVSVNTIYLWVRTRGFPHVRMGKLIRFTDADLAAWEAASRGS